jgi:hypothetical protein
MSSIKIWYFEDVLDFGRYKGRTLIEVIRHDPYYIRNATDGNPHFCLDDDAMFELYHQIREKQKQ